MMSMLPTGRHWTALAFLTVPLLIAAPAGAQLSDGLTPRDINEAIEWGLYGDPAPYLLHHRGEPGKVNPVIVGAVYTPFLRVALAAKAARDNGRSFTERDVSPKLIEPVAYVALRWYCCDRSHGADLASFNPFTPFDYKIAVPGDRVIAHSQFRVTARPLWIRRDVSLLASFGGDLPYRDVVLVAAYPMNVLSTGHDFVIYRKDPATHSGWREIRIGRVTPDDLILWR